MSGFFGVDGPVMRVLNEITTLLIVNVLCLILSIPVFTAGAALASLNYCIMKLRDGADAGVSKMFLREFKNNFKTITPAWLIWLLPALFVFFDYYLLGGNEGTGVGIILLFFLVVILFSVFVWMFPLAARFENDLMSKFKNAFLMAVLHLPKTLLMIFLYVGIIFVFTTSYRLLPLFFVFGISLPAYLSSYFYYPVIKKEIERVEGTGEDHKDMGNDDTEEQSASKNDLEDKTYERFL